MRKTLTTPRQNSRRQPIARPASALWWPENQYNPPVLVVNNKLQKKGNSCFRAARYRNRASVLRRQRAVKMPIISNTVVCHTTSVLGHGKRRANDACAASRFRGLLTV